MAVLDGLPGLEVEIVVNGQPLKEYTDTFVDEEEAKTVIKYVEAVSGANFEIYCRFTRPYPHRDVVNSAHVELDGEGVVGKIIRKSYLQPLLRGYTAWIKGRTTGQGQKWLEEKFRFAELTISTGVVILLPFGSPTDYL